jgi:hypothetical protein
MTGMNPRRIMLVTLTVVATALSACSSESKKSLDAATTSSVDTSTTTETTVADTTVITDAPTTVAATTPPTAPPTAPPATAPPGPGFYEQVAPPVAPTGHTDPFAPSGVLGDGYYFVQYNGGETQTPDITVVQAFFGAECVTEAEADGDECLNDIYVRVDPSRDIDTLPFAGNVYLTVADSSQPGISYFITPDELRTIRAGSPSEGAPDGYSFAGFPWLMTVEGGEITKFEQLWVP